MGLDLPHFDLLEILGYAFTFVFTLWPIMLLSPLRGRRHFLYNMLVVWSFLAVARVFLFFKPVPLFLTIIPEPLNTILFLATGVVLWSIKAGKGLWERRSLRMQGDSAGIPSDLLGLSARQFEEMVVEFYRVTGHKAKRTGATGDHGVDIVVQASDGEKWVVQCKRWRGAVGESIVRDFYGVIQHEKADEGIIITTGRFTWPAWEWAKGKPIVLYDGNQFLKLWKQARASEQAKRASPIPSAPATVPQPAKVSENKGCPLVPLCPKCQVPMVIRTARRGPYTGQQFYGCPNYPECREIVSPSQLPKN
jgi:hypothetical protein